MTACRSGQWLACDFCGRLLTVHINSDLILFSVVSFNAQSKLGLQLHCFILNLLQARQDVDQAGIACQLQLLQAAKAALKVRRPRYWLHPGSLMLKGQ